MCSAARKLQARIQQAIGARHGSQTDGLFTQLLDPTSAVGVACSERAVSATL